MSPRRKIPLLVSMLLLGCLAGCSGPATPKSDAELGLTAQQAEGRRIYDAHCLSCHEAYSRSGKNGPSLKGIFQKKYFPSGTPANDERMRDVINMGRPMMPAFRSQLTAKQMDDLLAYLHTL